MPKFNGKKYSTTFTIVVHEIGEDNAMMVHQIVETELRGSIAKNEIVHSIIGRGIGDNVNNNHLIVLLAALSAEMNLFQDFLEFAEKGAEEKENMLRDLLEEVIKGMRGVSDDGTGERDTED